jgi:hypothetical protein
MYDALSVTKSCILKTPSCFVYVTKHTVSEFFLFNCPNPSSRTMAPESTQPLTEMSTRNLPGGKGRPERRADNLTAFS